MTIYRATISSYLVLTGVWVALGIGYLILYLRNPRHDLASVSIGAWCIALLWCVWLRGFKITISDKSIQYRDGFFRSSSVDMNEIACISGEWVQWKLFGREVKILRIVVVSRSGESAIKINLKPFGRSALTAIKSAGAKRGVTH